jgi:hypothetical protein
VGLATRYYFLSECCCLKFAVLYLWCALSDERTGLQFAVQSLSSPSRSEPETIFTVSFETPPTWRARFPYLYPPITWWPSYTPRHWALFTSYLTTRRATVEISLVSIAMGHGLEDRTSFPGNGSRVSSSGQRPGRF